MLLLFFIVYYVCKPIINGSTRARPSDSLSTEHNLSACKVRVRAADNAVFYTIPALQFSVSAIVTVRCNLAPPGGNLRTTRTSPLSKENCCIALLQKHIVRPKMTRFSRGKARKCVKKPWRPSGKVVTSIKSFESRQARFCVPISNLFAKQTNDIQCAKSWILRSLKHPTLALMKKPARYVIAI